MLNGLEKSLPVNRGPIFEPSEDVNNEEFINANEKKFVALEDFPDPDSDSDFTEKESQEEEIGEENPSSVIQSVRQDINDYDYKREGKTSEKLESFHIDHNNKQVTVIYKNEADSKEDNLNSILTENVPLEEEFAQLGISQDRKIGTVFLSKGELPKYVTHSDGDNLKTMHNKKIQRLNRGLIRSFLDKFSRN